MALHQLAESEHSSGHEIVRFCCGILYKFALTTKELGRISLGPYAERCRSLAFDEKGNTDGIDAFAFRLVRYPGDTGLFAYRAPHPDSVDGVDCVRLMLGGVLFFVKVDERAIRDETFKPLWLRNQETFRYLVAPARMFEEYHIPAGLVHSNPELSSYLDNLKPPPGR